MKTSPLLVPVLFAGFLLSLIGCGNDSPSSTSASTQDPSKSPDQSKVLNLITWEEYVADSVLEKFTARTGIKVNFKTFDNTERLIALLRAYPTEYDVVIFDSSSLPRISESQLLQKIDRSRLSGLSNLDPKFLNLTTDPGNSYSVPYLWGSTLVAYRKDKISEPEQSFNLLWDESLKGKVLMLDDPFETLSVAHLLEGRSINSFAKEDLEAAGKLLKMQVRSNGAMLASDAEIRDALASGECWAAMCYSGDAAMVADENEEVGYFFPKEGAPLWMDNMTIARDARHVDAAYAFISFMLEPEVIAENSNELWYANPNLQSQSLLSEELTSDSALFPPHEVLRHCEFHNPMPAQASNVVSRLVREIMDEKVASN